MAFDPDVRVYNEARSHIQWAVRINPNDKVNGEIVDGTVV